MNIPIPVLGFDPSMRNWGIAYGRSDGSIHDLQLVRPQDLKGKQVRQNSKDLHLATQLSEAAIASLRHASIVCVETPVGSQNARAMASYGLCVGILASLKAYGAILIEVTPTEVKEALGQTKTASKWSMIQEAKRRYPGLPWLDTLADEHLADAIGALLAGLKTPTLRSALEWRSREVSR